VTSSRIWIVGPVWVDRKVTLDALGIEVSKTGHGFTNHNVQFFVLYMSVDTVYSVLR